MTRKTTSPKRSKTVDPASGEALAADALQPLRRWYRAHGRHELPWRLTVDPYAVLVSEVMLQQTQVERVLPYYETWLARWPDFHTLAGATPAEAISAWGGLGYNRRAVHLHRLATVVDDEYGGRLPRDDARLRQLPGIGPYTAAAVRSFAFRERTAVVDTNIGRVLARVVVGVAATREAGASVVAAAADRFLPQRSVRGHNLALMDLGAMVCRAATPRCDECPLAEGCTWRARGYPRDTTRARPSVRFEETARFARGRIVDALRGEGSLAAGELAQILPSAHRGVVSDYLQALERDGLIENEQDGRWQLTGSKRS